MKVFLDTNILIDILADRKPFVKWSKYIIYLHNEGKLELFTSGYSIMTTYYICSSSLKKVDTLNAIKVLLQSMHIVSANKSDLEVAISSSFNDYENAVQHQCAKQIDSLKYIITRNVKDYKKSDIEAILPEELISRHFSIR